MSDGAMAFEFDLDAAPEKVWRALTVPALLERWLLPEGGNAPGLDAQVETELLEADPPRSLSRRWREAGQDDDLVSVTLTPNEAGGTALKLVHMRRAFALPEPANGNSVMMLLRAA
jgi:uncharacterized protein YndB with AHSA1/START domain